MKAADRQHAPRVVKLGGSLLDLPRLASRLSEWLVRQTTAPTVLVVGGGRMVDVLRDADRRHQLGETVSHWLCIRAMTIQAEMLAAMLPAARLCRSINDWRGQAAALSVFDPWEFLRHEEPRLAGVGLPASWQVTSDSIAARLASGVDAAELVLLKSDLPRPCSTLADAAAAGYVDPLLPVFGGVLPSIRCVNLRGKEFPETSWRRSPPD